MNGGDLKGMNKDVKISTVANVTTNTSVAMWMLMEIIVLESLSRDHIMYDQGERPWKPSKVPSKYQN